MEMEDYLSYMHAMTELAIDGIFQGSDDDWGSLLRVYLEEDDVLVTTEEAVQHAINIMETTDNNREQLLAFENETANKFIQCIPVIRLQMNLFAANIFEPIWRQLVRMLHIPFPAEC